MLNLQARPVNLSLQNGSNLCVCLCVVLLQGHVVMGNNAVSPYQQVIEKTKSLSFRSQMLAMNIEKKVAHANRNEASASPLSV